MKFYLRVNEDLEGWDLLEKDGIQSDEGNEDSVVATFYEFSKAVQYKDLLNS